MAARAGTLAFSVYRNGRYHIEVVDEAAALAGATPPGSESLEPAAADPARRIGTLQALLADSRTGLPAAPDFPTKPYDDRLRLETVAPPFIGAATGGGFGGMLRASFGMSFADMLRDRQLQTVFRVGLDQDDFAAQVGYTNRRGQWNWGVAAGFVPSWFPSARRAIERRPGMLTRETGHLRYTQQWGGLIGHYHVNRAQRFEFGAGVRRTGFAWQTVTRVIDTVERKTLSRTEDERTGGRAVHLAQASAAFVHDTAVNGPVGPLLGERVRLEVEPAVGGLTFADVHVDARRYFVPVRPVTVAARLHHVGRYGPDGGSARLIPLVLGLRSLVRGYDARAFAAAECGRAATACSPLDELTGSRLALLNLEVRAPLPGLLSGNFYYGRLPIEVLAFADAGFLWTRRGAGPLEQDRFRSVGAGARVNLAGFVFELTAARPFDRPGKGWTTSLLLRPAW